MELPFPGLEEARDLAAGETHEYSIGLESGEAISLDVDQQGVDLILDARVGEISLIKIDSPIGDRGPEHFCLVAPQAGTIRLRVSAFSQTGAGRYSIRRSGSRKADRLDRQCFDVTHRFYQLETADKQPPWSDWVSRYLAVADRYLGIEHPMQAAVVLQQAARLSRKLPERARIYQRSLELIRSEGHRPMEVATLLRLGLVWNDLGEPEKARSRYLESLSIARELGDVRAQAYALNNLAILRRKLGHWHEALEGYLEAVEILRGLEQWPDVATGLNNVGFCLTALRRYREGLDRFGEAREVVSLLKLQGDSSPALDETLSNLWLNEGLIHQFQGSDDLAIESYRKAIQAGPKSVDEPKILNRLASAYRDQGRFSESREAYKKALALAREQENLPLVADIQVGVASLHQAAGRAAAAIAQLEAAFPSLERLRDPAILAFALGIWALAERDRGNLGGAKRRFEKGFEYIRSLRLTAWAQGEQLRPLSTWQAFLESYVDLLMRMHRRDPERGYDKMAFELADSERGRLFYESLLASQIQSPSRTNSDRAAMEEVQDLLKVRSEQRSRLLAHRDQLRLADIEVEIRNLRLRYERLRARNLSRNPGFAGLRDPRPSGLPELQAALDDETVLLRLFVGRESSVAFLVERSGFSSRLLPAGDEIEPLAQSIYQGWSSPQRRAIEPTMQRAADLSQLLLAGLENHFDKKRLVLVADGLLHYLPFASLPLPGSQGSSPARPNTATLIDQFELVQLPLAAALPSLRRRDKARKPAPHLLAVVADPVFSPDDERVSSDPRPLRRPPVPDAVSASDRPFIPRLPASRQEAETILNLAPASDSLLALDFEANASLFKTALQPSHQAAPLAAYRILHIATHVVIEDEYPELYKILLSNVTASGAPRNGSVALYEVYNLGLDADLVVLSGCQTALGKNIRGEGLVGWTRGFFNAGASRLLVSLWDIDDQATAEFMAEFYRGLFRRKLSPAAALRQAQEYLRGSPLWQHPYYWAGFVLQGDWLPISFSKNS